VKESSYVHADEVHGSVTAAERIVPALLAITGPVQSVVDVGGGTGAWLRAFQAHGAERILLLDEGAVEPDLLIESSSFRATNLNRPLGPLGRFDLAVCVECAEHLDSESAQPLVEALTSASDVVAFAAAVPGQGGKGHINEQWPDYWAALFAERGFLRRDVVRPRIIRDHEIPWWYRQNLFLYARIGTTLLAEDGDYLPPDFFVIYRDVSSRLGRPGLRRLLKRLGPALADSLRRRMRSRAPSP